MASNTLASLSSPSTNVWLDTGVTLQKSHFFLWASTSDCLTSLEDFNRIKILVIEQNCLWSENRERFWIKELRVLHPDGINRKQYRNRFSCIFSFTVFIVNEYFTTVTKLRICAHHLSLTLKSTCDVNLLSKLSIIFKEWRVIVLFVLLRSHKGQTI